MKTPTGFESYVNFDFGSEKERATAILEQLKGTDEVIENSVIYMDFTKVKKGVPLPIKVLHCTLDNIAYNVRIITRDILKISTFEKMT